MIGSLLRMRCQNGQRPLKPLHVERGPALDENAMTVIGASGTLNMNSHAKDAEDLLRAIADSTMGAVDARSEPICRQGLRAPAIRAVPSLEKIELQTRLPISVKAEDIGIIVAGGPGTHSVYVPTFGQTRAMTCVVRKPDS
jgi:hypothetical protein